MTAKADRVPWNWSTAAFGVAGGLLFLQLLFVAALFSDGSQYQLYWRPFHITILILVSVVLIVAPLATLLALILAIMTRRKSRLAVAAILVPTALILSLGNFIFWMALAWGNYSGHTVAEYASSTSDYRLDYTLAGDPPVSFYELLQCQPVNWWCRRLGSLYAAGAGHPPAKPAEFVPNADESLIIKIDSIAVARLSEGRFECFQTAEFWCP